jgi:hypothetical protein
MKETILSSLLEVRSAQAAAAFMDPMRRHLILSFVGREQGVAEVAKASGLSISLAHYHVRRLCELGILKLASVKRRAGRPIRKYTARASAYFIPDALQRRGFGAALDRELATALERRRDASQGWLAFVDRRGAMRMRREPARPSTSTHLDAWKILDLDDAAAASLAADLEEVLRRYERREPAKRQRRHLVRCAMVERIGDRLFSTGAADR